MSKLKALVLPSKARLDNVCPPDVFELINGYFDAAFNLTGKDYSEEEQYALIGDAEVLLTTWGSPVIDAAGLAKAPKLKYIGHAAGTVKSRLPYEAFARGVRVFSAAPRIAGSVADWCLAAIMAMLRRFPEFESGLREGGEWKGDEDNHTEQYSGACRSCDVDNRINTYRR
jgi:phosphoglycerate dehydrogenase-like enzyme